MGLEIVLLSHTILFVENEGTCHIFFFIISCFSLHACLCSPFSHVLGMNGFVAAVVALFTQLVIFTKQILQFVCEDQETRQTLKT